MNDAQRQPRPLMLQSAGALVLGGLFSIGLLVTAHLSDQATIHQTPDKRMMPDFSSFTEVKAKKDAFFAYLIPYVRRANEEITAERQVVNDLTLALTQKGSLDDKQSDQLTKLATKYRIQSEGQSQAEQVKNLLKRVDTIPASLTLAQAANESAWGTARFATRGKNFFGIWCWSANCGMVPKARKEGAKHEVAAFESTLDGVRYYMLNLNSHPAYRDLRNERLNLRLKQKPLSGMRLATGLLAYSERREIYVEEIQSMIRTNELKRFNRANTGALAASAN